MPQYIADVYYGDTLAGTLENSVNGSETLFTYDINYISSGKKISYNLPVRKESYITEGLHPFFDSMVSEGWLNKTQANNQKIDPNNRFLMLANNGHDLPGMVSVILRHSHEV
jgi:serine/threonine-protein kinase HipA